MYTVHGLQPFLHGWGKRLKGGGGICPSRCTADGRDDFGPEAGNDRDLRTIGRTRMPLLKLILQRERVGKLFTGGDFEFLVVDDGNGFSMAEEFVTGIRLQRSEDRSNGFLLFE